MKKNCAALALLVLLVGFVSYANAAAWDPVWSPDGTQIAFTCDYGGSTNIWIADADGSNPVQVTNHPFTDWDPDWSPDGAKIVFSHDLNGDNSIFNVWTVNIDGTNLTQLTFGISGWETEAVWSPDGTAIAYDGVWMMDADGANPVLVTSGIQPSFNGDGTRIVYADADDIWTANPDGSSPMQVTSDPGVDWHPDFSLYGSKIVFTSDRDGGNAIWTMNADGSNVVRIADASGTGEPQWSPDGSQILYEGPDANIWVVNADGTNPTPILTPSDLNVTMSVMSVHKPDDSYQKFIELMIRNFSGVLPDHIDDITITLKRPDNTETIIASYPADADWTFNPQWNSFFIAIADPPEIGYYEANISYGSETAFASDVQTRLQTIPTPDPQGLSPASGETVASTTPVFSWAPVVMDDPDAPPLFYRLEVADMSGTRVWASARKEGMTSCALPQGRLLPGQAYKWRVRVTDSSNWVQVQNRSHCAWVPFTMDSALSHGATPAVDFETYGVSTWSNYDITGLDVSVKVVDHDGVAYDGSSHQVTLTFPDSSVADMNLSYARGAEAKYSFWSSAYPQPGTYTVTVTDPDGLVAMGQEELVVDPIAPTTETSISPSSLDEFITATFDNVMVNGLPYDDFSTYADIWSLDPGKWLNPADCATIVGQALQMDLSNNVGRGHCGLTVADPMAANTIQADITVNNVSSNRTPEARIFGTYYFNGYADVNALIFVQGDRVGYEVFEITYANGVYSWNMLANSTLMTVSPSQTVTVSLDWDGATLSFTASDAAAPGTVYSAAYTATGLTAPPVGGRELQLQARTNLFTQGATPTFSWDPIVGAERYRLRVYDAEAKRTLWRGYTNDTQYKVPPGVLDPNAYYQFRIDGYGDHSQMNQDNASGTSRYRFYTGSGDSPVPHIEFDGSGVQTWNGDTIAPYLSFWALVHDAQGVPGNIRSVKVQLPDNGPVIDLLHETKRDPSPTSGFYRNMAFIDPAGQDGTYTFIVEDWDGNIYQTTEDLVVDVIGYPDPGSMVATVTGTAVTVDWEDVPGAGFYRLEIYDKDFNRLHALATLESQYSIPEGFLKANTYYRYRVSTRREFFDENVDNGSHSPWSRFKYPTFVTAPETSASLPLVDLGDFGVSVWHTQKQGTALYSWWHTFRVKVTDADGVPENIKQVKVTFPDGITERELVIDDLVSSTEGYYWLYDAHDDPASIPEGLYTFTVTDQNDTTVQVTDTLVKNDLPLPENCQPAAGAVIVDTTPVISWDSVAGASGYEVKIYAGFDTPVHISGVLTEAQYTVPAGILTVGNTFNYRVSAYRENYPTEEVDNFSANAIYPSERPYFTVAEDGDGDGVADVLDNCPDVSNPGQIDTDLDALGNLCDDDADGDGLTNDVDTDDDGDGLPDIWESAHGLDPLDDTGDNGGSGDLDNDGWSNAEELLYGTLPDSDTDVPPPLVAETIPHNGAGVSPDATRVASNSLFAILVRDPGGIDLTDATSIQLTIDDNVLLPYSRDLSSASITITKVEETPDSDATRFWVTYHRQDDMGADWDFGESVSITAEIADSLGTAGRVVETVVFEVETQAEQDAANAASPPVTAVAVDDPLLDDPAYSAPDGIEVTEAGDPLEGAAIVFDQSETVTPGLGPVDELPLFEAPSADAVGVPLNLQPPAVFNTPVKIRIPCPGVADVSILDIHYFNGTDWVLACTPYGVAPEGADWMVDESRVNRNDLVPPAIEIKVYHFSGAQATEPKMAHWTDHDLDWDVDGSDLAIFAQDIVDGDVSNVEDAAEQFAARYGR